MVIDLTVDVKEAERFFRKAGGDSKKIGRRVLATVASKARNKIKREYFSFFKHGGGTGNLRKYIKNKSVNKGMERDIYSVAYKKDSSGKKVFYGFVHQAGTTILPKKAKVLRFQVDGKWVAAKEVRLSKKDWLHGPADRYMRSSASKTDVEKTLQKEINKLAK